MGRRATSPRLIGRETELVELLEAVQAEDPDRPLILVAGEAGIGKTRLLTELTARVAEGAARGRPVMTTVSGSCLRLSQGELPFAPILEILDGLSGDEIASSVGLLRARLSGAGPGGVRSPEARTLRFLAIRDALVAAAGSGRLVVVIDDVHWADRSTLDLLLFLARRLRGGPVVVVVAYRTDELHRRHPLRPILAELSRGFVRARIDIGPLSLTEVEQQLAELRGTSDPGVAAAIAQRADGNPFFVEELAALDPGRPTLPPSVRDVLLAHLAAVDSVAMRVLAACAVVGHDVDVAFLAQVLALERSEITEALGRAVDHSILVPAPDGRSYRFRHGLLEEAVEDDLLPGDRVELHRHVAAALVERAAGRESPSVPPAELACHLDLAGQPEAAIEAFLDAADAAFRVLAWAEGVADFERADQLLRALPDRPASQRRLADLVEPTARAMNWAGTPSRSIALLRSWITRAESAGDIPHAASALVTLSRILNDVGDERASREATARAARLQPPDPTTAVGVDLLTGMSSKEWILGRSRAGLRNAEQAVAGAERLADPLLLFRALVQRACVRITLGHLEPGLADLDRARHLQIEHGWLDTYGQLATNVGMALLDAGELEPPRELWREALRMSEQLGTTRSWDPWNLAGLALDAYLRGQWHEADGLISAARVFKAPGMPTAWNEFVAALLAAGRGDLVAADRSISLIDEHMADVEGESTAVSGFARTAHAEATGDPLRRLEQAETSLGALEGFDTFVLRSRLAVEAAAAASDLATSVRPARDRERIEDARTRARIAATLAADVDAGLAVPGTVSVRWTRANAALAALEAARAEGDDDPAGWPAVADAFRDLGMAPRVAYALFRGASTALRVGLADEGAARLLEAAALAESIGMAVLGHRIEALGRAARIELRPLDGRHPARSGASDPWGLSPREREVLALLAEGRTNGEIGAALFISTKTASVHVTHILDKLGVSSRTEAALAASRAGVLD